MNRGVIHDPESVNCLFQITESAAKAGYMVPSEFGRWVKRRLGELEISQRGFSAQVGISQANLNKILNGSHEAPPPPLGLECAKWAEVLKIPDDQIKRFHLYAACAHIPMPQRVEFEGIIHEHLVMRDRLPELERQVRRVAEQSDEATGQPRRPGDA